MMDQIKNRKILLDTNILVYCSDKSYGNEAKPLLRRMMNNKNLLATSWISCFELIKNAPEGKIRDYYFKLINYLYNAPIEQSILQNGYLLYHLYDKEWSNKSSEYKKIESIDLIIGGTIMSQKGALLLTGNRKHFPEPFWKLIAQEYFIRQIDERYELQNVYLLEFDHSRVPSQFK